MGLLTPAESIDQSWHFEIGRYLFSWSNATWSCCSVTQLYPTLCDPMESCLACQASLSFTIRVCSNSCPLNQWRHPTISSSVVPFFCLQSFPASGSFQLSQFFASGGQSIGVSASASVLPMNIQNAYTVIFPMVIISMN